MDAYIESTHLAMIHNISMAKTKVKVVQTTYSFPANAKINMKTRNLTN